MRLIYRANTYAYTPAPQQLTQPRAINWRYRVFAEVATHTPARPAAALTQPRAINWRYQVVAF